MDMEVRLLLVAAVVLSNVIVFGIGYRAGMAKVMPYMRALMEIMKLKEVLKNDRVQGIVAKWCNPRGDRMGDSGHSDRGRFGL